MSERHDDFARDILTLGDACASVLSRLYEVVQAEQRSVLALAAQSSGHRGSSGNHDRARAVMSALSPGAAPANAAQSEGAAKVETPAEGAEAAPGAAAEALLAAGVAVSHALAEAAPEVALAGLHQVIVHAIGLAAYNVVNQQQNLAILAQAIITTDASRRSAAARPSADEAKDAARPAADAAPRAAAR